MFEPAPRVDVPAAVDDWDEVDLAQVLAQFEADCATDMAAAGGFGMLPADPAGGEYPAEEVLRHGVDPSMLGPEDDLTPVEHLAALAAVTVPGPELAGLLAQLTDLPAATLTPAARVEVLVAAERLGRWLSALTLRVLVDHVGAEELVDRAPVDWSGVEQRGRVAEVAVACETSEHQVRDRLALARALSHPGAPLSATGRALASGDVSERHARVLAETTAVLTVEDARQVERQVLDKATGRDPSRFRQVCRRAVLRIDPDAACRRHELARQDRSVAWWSEADGMARLHVYGPAPEVMAIHGVVDLLAGPKAAGDDRNVGARRFDALLQLCLATAAPRDEPDRDVRPRCGTRPPVQAQIVVDLATLIGLADNPAELRGYGPIPAGVAREWLAESTTWRRLVTDPVTGHLLDYGRVVRLAPPRLRDFVLARDASCAAPGCNRRASGRGVEIDHHPPWRPDGSGGAASAAATGALCAHHHHLKTHGHWDVLARDHGTTTWRAPSGREHQVVPEPVLPG